MEPEDSLPCWQEAANSKGFVTFRNKLFFLRWVNPSPNPQAGGYKQTYSIEDSLHYLSTVETNITPDQAAYKHFKSEDHFKLGHYFNHSL